jgi:hypothetical protein
MVCLIIVLGLTAEFLHSDFIINHGRDSTPFKGIRQLKNLSTIKTIFLAYSLLIVLTFKISWFICSIIAFLMFLPVILILRCKDNGTQITEHEVKIEEDNDVAVDVEIPSCNRDNQIVPTNKIEVDPMSAYKETKSEQTEKKS